jgi:methionyl-tRNA formyltransferase
VLANFSFILRGPFLAVPRLGSINVHPSLLPAYRGPYPLRWALANGERRIGVTTHFVDSGIDSGPILLQRIIDVRPGATERSLTVACLSDARDLVQESVALVFSGRARPTPQNGRTASYYPGPSRVSSRVPSRREPTRTP